MKRAETARRRAGDALGEGSRLGRGGPLLPIALLVGALLAAFGIAELGVRVWAHSGSEVGARLASRDPLGVLFVPYGEHGYRQSPGRFQPYWNGTRANWNEMGYRGPAVEISKPPNTVRIVLLGGSTTHGYGVDDDQTIDAHMRSELASRYPEVRWEVVNLSLGGYDSYQLLERMRVDALPLSPDVVIVNSGINDVRNARFANLANPDPRTLIWAGNMERMREEMRSGGPSVWTRLRHHIYLARLPGLLLENLRRRETIAASTEVRPHPDALDYFETNISAIADLARQMGAVLVLSTPASLLDRKPGGETSDIDYWIVDAATTQHYRDLLAERLRRVASQQGASGGRPIAYVSHALETAQFLDDCHLTGDGNRAVARNLVDALAPWVTEVALAGRRD